jgi:hypothetical protein
MPKSAIGIVFAVALISTAWAEPSPKGVLACATETDPDKRLACYDREAARAGAPMTPPQPSARANPPQPAGTTPHDTEASTVTAVSVKPPRHLSAHVVRLEYSADELIVHLDNDQVWKSVPDSVRIALHEGDAVELDRQWGSWWLSGRYGRAIQVRQEK